MIDYRDWYKSATGQRVTAETIGKLIGASRSTVTRRLTQDGLTAIAWRRGLKRAFMLVKHGLGHWFEPSWRSN